LTKTFLKAYSWSETWLQIAAAHLPTAQKFKQEGDFDVENDLPLRSPHL
jgi:hypothetical protein